VVYATSLKKMRDNELQDERRRVNYQEGKTPERRGETIMQDEISKETIRRYYLNQKARSPLRIFASIYTSRDRGSLSGMNKCHHAIGGSANLSDHQVFFCGSENNRDMKQ
jgi:hypothetical protein